MAELVEDDLESLRLRPVPRRRLLRAISQSKRDRSERNGGLLGQLQADLAAVDGAPRSQQPQKQVESVLVSTQAIPSALVATDFVHIFV